MAHSRAFRKDRWALALFTPLSFSFVPTGYVSNSSALRSSEAQATWDSCFAIQSVHSFPWLWHCVESVTIVPKQAVEQTFLVPVVTSATVLWVFFQYKLESMTMVISAVPKQAVEQTFVVPVITSVIVLCFSFQYKLQLYCPHGEVHLSWMNMCTLRWTVMYTTLKKTSGACGDWYCVFSPFSGGMWLIYTALKAAWEQTFLVPVVTDGIIACVWSVFRWDVIYAALKQAWDQTRLVPVVIRVIFSIFGLKIIVSWAVHPL